MRTTTRMTMAAGGAVALGAAPLGAVFEEWRWIWYAWAAIAAVAGANLLARSLRLPAALVPVAGALGLLLYLTAVFTPDGAVLGLLPTPDSLRLLDSGLADGMQNVNEYSTPVPTTEGLVLLTAAALGVLAIVVDLVAVTWRRPAASGLALLALYAVPTAVVLGGVPWILFAIAASGYLMLLLVEGQDRLLHWGRPVTSAPRQASVGDRIAVPRDSDAPPPLTGQRIGAVAILLAVVLPVLVPGMTGNALNRLGQSGSDGTGTGFGGPLNEFAALRGQLRQGQRVDLMRVRTDLEQPAYLRTKVLDRYQSAGFSASGTTPQVPVGEDLLPLPRGQTGGDERSFRTDIELTDRYDDDHLPIYYVPSQVRGAGDGWRWDQDKAVVVNRKRRGDFSYTVHGQQPTPSLERLESAAPLSDAERDELPDKWSFVPGTLPQVVDATVAEVTRGMDGPYRQAKAINDYFTDGTNNFTYAENTLQGNSGSVLVDFLRKKQGYCEQYAAAMAVMLRVAGIPSRVVIGYTPGHRGVDGTWTVTNRDAHAWVEAYFSGVGWAYFDPTPLQDGRTVAPNYAPRPESSQSPSASNASGASASAGPTGNQIPEEDLAPGADSAGQQDQGLVTPRRLLIALGVLAVLALLLLPALVRLVSRRRRLRAAAGADPEAAARAAWDEVVGTAVDFGLPVPASETPRGLARRLDRDLGLDADASHGLRLVALAEERARYAARAGVNGDLPAAVGAVRRGLRGGADRRRRWQATLLPLSTVRSARAESATRAAAASTALNRLGEAVRRPVTPRRRR